MRRLCPTMSELNAFHSSARHASFTQAADELCVTQGAISRHVASLEEYLGQQLFTRSKFGLAMTDAGRTYLRATLPALSALESATAQMKAQGGPGAALNLAVPPTMATQWLFPRLGHFRRVLPQFHLNFVHYVQTQDFTLPTEFDASIQYGTGAWQGADARYLIGRENSIVCNPELRDKLDPARPSDLKTATLLQHLDVPLAWREWLQSQGCDEPSALFGPRFYQFALIIRAALSGYGVGMIPTFLIEDEIASGALVELFPRHSSSLAYYLCSPPTKSTLPSLQLFGDWLTHCRDHEDGAVVAGTCRFCAGQAALMVTPLA